ncbi:MAG: ASKHA domain-containing protein [Pirellulales bacterium]|nr:ASKHA domain-containing protein [Pirellulales bacterium]
MTREREVLVRFRPSGREAFVLPGTRLVEAAAEAGLLIDVPCGGEGTCGKCRLIVASGAAEPTTIERKWFSDEELQTGWRLACQSAVDRPAEVDIPSVSLATVEQKILVRYREKKASELFSEKGVPTPFSDPPVRKQYVELRSPTRGDDLPDALRLERALGVGPLAMDVSLLRELSARLREDGFRGTAVLAGDRLLDFEIGNTEADAFAAAVDLGTTTLAGELMDLGTGSEWATTARLNPQTRFGDDVLSRILHAREKPDGLARLQEAIISAVDEMIGELCLQAGVPRQRVYELAVAGNTTMQQLLCGVDPGPLGEVPFVPTGGRGISCPAAELGIHIHPRGSVYVMPAIGGFVGGDTVAGLLAIGLADTEGPALFVDIGTNGEIVLLADGRLSAASTAAGPAFEGARISRGMRGGLGAIEKVVVDGHLRINVIGNVPPTGICGSGLIDAAAELLRHRLLGCEGRLRTPDQCAPLAEPVPPDVPLAEPVPPDVPLAEPVPPDLAERIVLHDGQVSFLLADEAETADRRPIVLTQRDIRELQLAAGAIRAGIAILLRRAGLEPKDLELVLIGGGFGNFIRRGNAQRIGLLPTEIERHCIRYMGNTSLAGARLAALSGQARCAAEELARRAEHVDLSTDTDFSREFAEAMIFPEVDS